VNDGCVLQIFSADYPHVQLLRKTVDSRDQGYKGCKCEHNRRDEEDGTDERKNADGNQALFVRFHAVSSGFGAGWTDLAHVGTPVPVLIARCIQWNTVHPNRCPPIGLNNYYYRNFVTLP